MSAIWTEVDTPMTSAVSVLAYRATRPNASDALYYVKILNDWSTEQPTHKTKFDRNIERRFHRSTERYDQNVNSYRFLLGFIILRLSFHWPFVKIK